MDTYDELASLEEALRNARRLLEDTRARAQSASAPTILATLNREKLRAQRYNHYFSIAVMSSPRLGTSELLRAAAEVFRASDMIGVLDADGHYHLVDYYGPKLEELAAAVGPGSTPAVAALLPETDRSAAGCALKRFESMLTSDDQVRVGLAVYPDDSTDTAELLRIAAG